MIHRDSFRAQIRTFLVEPKDVAPMARQPYDDVSDVRQTLETIIKAAGG